MQVIAQNDEYKIDHIGYAQGLSSQLITCVKEDNNGHLWIATFTELNKYDGFQTKIYDSNNTILSNGYFEDLLKDSRGNIWSLQVDLDNTSVKRYRNSEYLFFSYDISIIDPITSQMSSLEDYLDESLFNSKDIIWTFQRDDTIYITCKDGQVYKYTDRLERSFNFNIDQQFVGITNRNTYCVINKQNIITEYDFSNKLAYEYNDINLAKTDRVEIDDQGNLIYMDTSAEYYQGLYLLQSGVKTKLPNYILNADNQAPPEDLITRKLNVEIYQGHLSMIGKQSYFWNDSIDVFSRLGSPFKTLSDIEFSESENYYIATDIGVSILQKKENYFKNFHKGKNNINSVRGMLKYDDIVIAKGDNNKAIAYSPDGSYKVDFFSNKMHYGSGYYRDDKNKDHIWACGHVHRGVQLLDLKAQKQIPPSKVLWHSLNNFYKSDYTETLYVYGKSGLFKKTGDPSTWESVNLEVSDVSTIGINHIAPHDNKLYLATDEGLLIYDEINLNSFLIPIIIDEVNSKLSFIHKDKNEINTLWLGTKHHGILKYEIASNSRWHINTDYGLSNNNVHAILEDDLNRLWISTNKYLNCFDKSDSTNYIFTTEHGLSHEEFNKFSYYQDESTGQFYFGGLDGFNYFLPNEILIGQDNLQSINVTEAKSIRKSGKEIHYKPADINSSYLNIHDNDVVIDFTLTMNNVFNSENRIFFYRIKGISDSWSRLDGNKLTLTRLPHGKYTLEIVADRYSPNTQTSTKEITLNFVKPFYKSYYFIAAVVLSILVLSYFWFRNKNERIKKKNRLLEELVNARTKELQIANETKNKIIAILSHDLRSPMGGLRDYYEKLDFLLKKDRVDEIQEISNISKSRIQHLENTLDNLLLWALAESQTLTTKAELLSLHHEINNALHLSEHIIDKKKLNVKNQLVVMDQVMVDKNILQTILRNIIHNALKFSYQFGSVIIKKLNEDEEYLSIVIRDFGIGMDHSSNEPELLRMLNTNQGLGFGLSTSKDLAKIGKIGVAIESKGIQGTKVILKLPKKVIEKASV